MKIKRFLCLCLALAMLLTLAPNLSMPVHAATGTYEEKKPEEPMADPELAIPELPAEAAPVSPMGAPDCDHIGIIGNIGDSYWDTDYTMIEISPDIYTLTLYLDARYYEIKIRVDASWKINWGGEFAGFGQEFALNLGDNNICFEIKTGCNVTFLLDLTDFDGTQGAKCTITTDAPSDEPISSGTCGENLTWTLTENGVLTISGTGEMYNYSLSNNGRTSWYDNRDQIEKLVVEDGVESIGDFAFNDCSSLTSVTIGDGVTSIGESAFYYCTSLVNITIGDNVTSIGNAAFFSCSSLTSVIIPDGVLHICPSTFYDCRSLTSVTIPAGIISIDRYAFYNCSSLVSVTIPEGVASIGDYAFNGCTSLTDVTIMERVTSIGSYAFSGCVSLTSVTILDGLISIGEAAFYGCSNLADVTLPDSINSIGNAAFYTCSSLTDVTIPKNVTSIGNYAFKSCTSLTSVTIPGSITSIGEDVFYDCISLTDVTILEGVTSIGYGMFDGCTSLTYVSIPESITSIGKYAFCGCASLTEIAFEGNAPSIGANAFYHVVATAYYPIENETWTSGVMQNYGGTITWVGYEPPNCDNGHQYKAVVTEPTCTAQGYTTYTCAVCGDSYVAEYTEIIAHDYVDGACRFCGKTEVVILGSGYCGENVTWTLTSDGTLIISGTGDMRDLLYMYPDVHEWADHEWDGQEASTFIKTVIIEEGVTSIGDGAFAYCTGLTSISIASSVTRIGYVAFAGCDNLQFNTYEGAQYLGNAENPYFALIHGGNSTCIYDGTVVIAGEAFAKSSISGIVIPDSVIGISDSAFENCDNLTEITIHKGVIRIGDYAFRNCDRLTGIWVEDDNPNYCSDARGVLYNKDMTTLLQAPGAISGDYVIAETVTCIFAYAFHNCDLLQSVTIPDSVTQIGDSAFSGCSTITSIIVGNGLSDLGYWAFSGCESLKYNQYGNACFLGNAVNPYLVLVCDANSDILSCMIPDGTKYIMDGAFSGCDKLITVSIPGSVIQIGCSAFPCESLWHILYRGTEAQGREIEFCGLYHGGGVVCEDHHFGEFFWGSGYGGCDLEDEYCFYKDTVLHFNCTGDEVTDTATGGKVCRICNDTKEPEAPEVIASGTCGDHLTWTLTEDGVLTISGTGDMTYFSEYSEIPWYSYRNSVVMVVIEDGVTSIGNYAFYNCTSLTSVTIPDGVTRIGNYAFRYCNKLRSVTIPDSVIKIGYFAFSNCSNLILNQYDHAYYLGNSENPYYALIYATDSSITTCAVHDDTKIIAGAAFYECANLTDVTLSNNVIIINEHVFDGCASLTNIEIPVSVTSIGKSAFRYCSSLTSVTIPDGVTSIGDYAFNNCSKLRSVTIPDSVIKIGYFAFSNCSNLILNQYDHAYYLGNSENPYYALIYATDSSITTCAVHDDTKIIAGAAFYECANLTDVTLGHNVIIINEHVFDSCVSLTKIEIPVGVTSIGKSAFRYCSSLTSVTIPDSVTSIGNYAFYYCESLRQIAFQGDAPSIGVDAFYKVTATVYYPAGNATWTADVMQDYGGDIIWEGYTSSGCENGHIYDTVVTEPTCTTGGYTTYTCVLCGDSYVGDYTDPAHDYVDGVCTVCGDIDWPLQGVCGDNLTWTLTEDGILTISGIGDMTNFSSDFDTPWYSYRNSVVMIVIEDGVTSIGNYAFCSFENLTGVTIPDSVTSIGYRAFLSCTSLTSVTIPDGVTSIGKSAFECCSSLTIVTIGNSVTSIGENAFAYCSSLNSVTIGNSVISIGEWAFSFCSSLTSVTIPDSLTSIGNSAFSWCANLASVTIPDSVISIGDGAFCNCSSLTNVTIGNSVTSIGQSAFSGCTGLTSVTIPDSVTSICENVFAHCTSLTSVTIGNSVTSIGNSAFEYCSSLTSMTIPDSVTSIGENVFAHCTSLTEIVFEGNAPSIGTDALYKVVATAYYPLENETWIPDVMQNYGGTITWVGYESPNCDNGHSYDAVVTEPTCTTGGYTTYTCTVCGYSFVGEYVDPIAHSYNAEGICTSCGATIGYVVDLDIDVETLVVEDGSYYTPDGNLVVIALDYPLEWLDGMTLKQYVDTFGDTFFSMTYWEDLLALMDENGFVPLTEQTLIWILDVITGNPAWGENEDNLRGYLGIRSDDVQDHEHQYSAVITEPTCTTGGYTTYTCVLCGDSYVGDYTDPAHDYVDGVCTVCGDIDWPLSGQCGDNLTWTLTEDGVLTISGTGAMWDFSLEDPAPWYPFAEMIKTVILSDGVTSIGAFAFYGCINLLSIVVPETVTYIYDGAFYGCGSLTGIRLPGGLISVGSGAFTGCENLEEIELPEGITSIGGGMFSGCTNLTEIHIPGTVETIGAGAFSGCTNLISVTIPDSVTTIGAEAFAGCENLQGLILPDSVTSIGDYAFFGCVGLTTITIPASILSIGEYAFGGCTSIETIIFLGEAPAIADTAFTDVVAKAYYPACNNSWTEEVRRDYGGTLTWVADDNGHTYGAWIVDVEVSCTENGLRHRVCEVCGKTVEEVLYAPGHDMTAWEITLQPTLTERGEACRHCQRCGYSESKELPMVGDVNDDGKIDTTDAKLIMQYDLGLVDEAALKLSVADVNGDGKVDTTDAKLIMQLDLGLITEFPKP